jgi:hypothetical protein
LTATCEPLHSARYTVPNWPFPITSPFIIVVGST